MALGVRARLETLERASSKATELRVSGGGARIALWNQIKADVTGTPVVCVPGDSTAAGTAMLAGLGAGIYRDVGEAVATTYRPGPVAEPDPRHRGLYDEMYARYLALTGSKEAEMRTEMRTEMRARLGINNCFAVKRWPRPDDWAAIVKNDLGLDTVELSLDVLAGPDTPAGRDRMAEQTRVALVRHGLRADTVFTGLAAYSLNLLMHPDAEYRAAARRWYREAIDLTAQLGATAVGGHVGALTVPDSADPARRAQRWADLRENLAELAAYAHQCGLDHLLVENLVTDREPSTMALVEDILAERSVAHASVQLCLDLGHPFVCGGSPADRDPYAWLEHFGPRIAEVQLQQSDGLADHHWPFTPERNATGLVHPGRVLDTLAAAGVTDVLLILEVIPAFEADDRQVLSDLRASAEVWRRALADRALAERGLP